MEDIPNTIKLLNNHLNLKNLNSDEKLWRIEISDLGGRGLFANRDINPGEIIFIDHPLVIGPRASKESKIHCVICYNLNNIHACFNGCGLPLCSTNCEQSSTHLKECVFIKKLNNNEQIPEISIEIFRSLVPLRCLLLSENSDNLLKSMIHHKRKNDSFEVELIKSKLVLSESEESTLKLICSILDSNIFESVVKNDNNQISLRGIYFLSAMMNHCCTPNTTHYFDNNQNMIVKSTVTIKKDAEIFTTYTSLLWGTTSRRHHLATTKHFWCHCNRCKDPKEFGTCLTGLKCILKECKGVLYPLDPLNIGSQWQCDVCDLMISSQKIGVIQSSLGALLKTIDVSDLRKLITFLKERLGKFVPLKNQIAIEIKCKIIWVLGNTENYYWKDISDEHLIFKEQLCRELLQLLTDLEMGQSSMRGLILYELYRCLNEKSVRISFTENLQNIEELEAEGRICFQEAVEILDYDVTAPAEIKNIVNCSQN